MKNKIIIIAIVVLVAVIGVTAYLNSDSVKKKAENEKNQVISILVDGKEVAKPDMKYIKSLGGVEFEANLKKSGKAAEKHKFTGVPLKKIFEGLKIDTSGKSTVIAKAVDGYNSAITMDEAMQDNNVYIVYEMDKKSLGEKSNGGSGPFELVISQDQFSQRWCKFLAEVEIK